MPKLDTIETRKKRFGDLLVEAGIITRQNLDDALLEQQHSKRKLGEILIDHGVITERQIVDFLSRHLRVPRLNLDKFTPRKDLDSVISRELAQRTRTVPLLRKSSLLLVATVDPTDIASIDELQQETHFEIESVICTRAEFRQAFEFVYNAEYVQAEDNLFDFEAIVDTEETSIAEQIEEEAMNVSSLQNMAEEAPVIKLVNSILLRAVKAGASDVHIRTVRNRVQLQMRIDGKLKDIEAFPKKYFLPVVSRIKLLSKLDISVTRLPQDGRFTYRAGDSEISVRTSTIPTLYDEKVVLRLHMQGRRAFSLEDLGLGEREQLFLRRAARKPHGMILTTGPTGSGKTTLLYTLLDMIYEPGINIMTLEDPIESRVDYLTQIQLNTKAGMTFASGLRSMLRQDPDVIMVGEIRDMETAKIAIESSMTGHKVLSTLHTNDATSAITRFMEMGIEPFLIASTVLVVAAQRLLRRICPQCIEPYQAKIKHLRAMGMEKQQNVVMHFFKGKGCSYCSNTGYKGRIGVFEVLNVDDMVQQMIIKRASAYEIKQMAVESGNMFTLQNDAARKVLQGLTTFEEYVSVAL